MAASKGPRSSPSCNALLRAGLPRIRSERQGFVVRGPSPQSCPPCRARAFRREGMLWRLQAAGRDRRPCSALPNPLYSALGAHGAGVTTSGNNGALPGAALPPGPATDTHRGISSRSRHGLSPSLRPYHRITESLRLEKTSHIPKSNPTMPTAHVPQCHIPTGGLPPSLGSCAAASLLLGTINCS